MDSVPISIFTGRLSSSRRSNARNHRKLRALGVTVRATIDALIATFCIVEGHELLHCDRAFDPFERHLGLRVVRA